MIKNIAIALGIGILWRIIGNMSGLSEWYIALGAWASTLVLLSSLEVLKKE
jgi:hypothetical protein